MKSSPCLHRIIPLYNIWKLTSVICVSCHAGEGNCDGTKQNVAEYQVQNRAH